MPPKFKCTREEIVQAALDITREEGINAVTARALGARLGTSSKPIFSLFQNMEEVHQEVEKAAKKLYHDFLEREMSSGKYHPYKASGMGYIHFAKEEKELFKFLFMRDRSKEAIAEGEDEDWGNTLDLIQKTIGGSEQQANKMHMEMWLFTHGIATVIATSFLDIDDETISNMIADVYKGVKGSNIP